MNYRCVICGVEHHSGAITCDRRPCLDRVNATWDYRMLSGYRREQIFAAWRRLDDPKRVQDRAKSRDLAYFHATYRDGTESSELVDVNMSETDHAREAHEAQHGPI